MGASCGVDGEEKEKEQKRNIEKVTAYIYVRCACNQEVCLLVPVPVDPRVDQRGHVHT